MSKERSDAVKSPLDRMVMFFKDIVHVHKYKTLLIYPPHNQKCNLPQCSNSNEYGFMIQCECGHMKTTKLPYTITEIFTVK